MQMNDASAQVRFRRKAAIREKLMSAKCPNSEVTGYHFCIFNALRGRAFFPNRQREAQLLPNITQRGCA
jgi:hypothetical protein